MISGASIRSRSTWAAALLAAFVCLGLLAFRQASPAPPSISTPARSSLDLTFLVASDTHLGAGLPAIESRNRAMIERMNQIAGTHLPAVLSGTVGTPTALLVTGDLTERGRESEWQLFTRFYGLKGQDGLLRYPVFETFGNHDHAECDVVPDRVRERHGGPFYAFDLQGIHFVSLGEAPEEQGLAFLANDFKTHPVDTPTVLFFHLPLLGPWAEFNWFTQGGFRERLATLLQGRRILAIFQGHSHFSSAYRWNGIAVYNPGSVKHSQRAFLVVHIREDAMTVAAWNLDFGSWWWWRRTPLGASCGTDTSVEGLWAPPGFAVHPWLKE